MVVEIERLKIENNSLHDELYCITSSIDSYDKLFNFISEEHSFIIKADVSLEFIVTHIIK